MLKKRCVYLLVLSVLAGGQMMPAFAAEAVSEEKFAEAEESQEEILADADTNETEVKEAAADEAVSEFEELVQDEGEAYSAAVGKVTGLTAKGGGSKSVVLNWNRASGANIYIILRLKNGGKAKQIGYTAQNVFVDTAADDTDFNFYWVVPYNINKKTGTKTAGPLSPYVYAVGRYIAAVRNLKAVSVSGGNRLTWSPASGANAYVILSKTGSPKAAYNQTVTVTGTSYTDTAAPAGKVTYYWVNGIYTKNGKSISAGLSSDYAWAVPGTVQSSTVEITDYFDSGLTSLIKKFNMKKDSDDLWYSYNGLEILAPDGKIEDDVKEVYNTKKNEFSVCGVKVGDSISSARAKVNKLNVYSTETNNFEGGYTGITYTIDRTGRRPVDEDGVPDLISPKAWYFIYFGYDSRGIIVDWSIENYYWEWPEQD